MIGTIDIGGTKLLSGVSRGNGTLEAVVRRETRSAPPLATLIEMLEEASQGSRLEAIGMAVPGPFDRARGKLINPPGMPETWWQLDLREALGSHFNCPVAIENDANCAALAEARFGAGRGYHTVAYFTVSTGIGTGIVRDGELVVGRHDTEGGHMVLWPQWLGGPPCDCGAHGCLETLASGRAIQRQFGVPAQDLTDAGSWEEVGRWLGLGVVNATSVVDPDVVVFGGGVCHQWDRFEAALIQTVKDNLRLQPAPEIVRASLGH